MQYIRNTKVCWHISRDLGPVAGLEKAGFWLLITKTQVPGAGFRKICYNFSILYKLRCYQDTGHVLALIVVVQCQNTITYL